MALIYKILTKGQWQAALSAGVFAGAPVDLADGYIHFSSAATVRETARKHFAAQEALLLAAIEEAVLGSALVWEVSRGGALFPHLYSALDPALVASVAPLPLGPDGLHVFPDEIP